MEKQVRSTAIQGVDAMINEIIQFIVVAVAFFIILSEITE